MTETTTAPANGLELTQQIELANDELAQLAAAELVVSTASTNVTEARDAVSLAQEELTAAQQQLSKEKGEAVGALQNIINQVQTRIDSIQQPSGE